MTPFLPLQTIQKGLYALGLRTAFVPQKSISVCCRESSRESRRLDPAIHVFAGYWPPSASSPSLAFSVMSVVARSLRNMQPQTKKALADLALLAISQIALFYGFRYVMTQIDPTRAKREEARKASREALKRLGVKDMELDEHEMMLAGEVIHPQDIEVGFSGQQLALAPFDEVDPLMLVVSTDIGGLDPIISDLRESIIYPLCYPALFKSTAGLFGAPKGVLLYGPPGCGKTMMAKAMAKESSATFINIKPSDLSSKVRGDLAITRARVSTSSSAQWFGESSKLVAALFSLARKLQPTIIFVDEIDSFMRERSRTDHEVTGMMCAPFPWAPASQRRLRRNRSQEGRVHDVRAAPRVLPLTG